jgi:hypothetical protein
VANRLIVTLLLLGGIVLAQTKTTCDAGDKEILKHNMSLFFDMSPDAFEKMGLCRLSGGEYEQLVLWLFSRDAAPQLMTPHAAKRIYVRLNFQASGLDVIKSAYRRALRLLGDVEIVEDQSADANISVSSLALTLTDGKLTGYVVHVRAYQIYDVPHSFRPRHFVDELGTGQLGTVAPEGIDRLAQQQIAALDNTAFEYLRKQPAYTGGTNK